MPLELDYKLISYQFSMLSQLAPLSVSFFVVVVFYPSGCNLENAFFVNVFMSIAKGKVTSMHMRVFLFWQHIF